jgi:hypothetical protein
MTHIILFSWHVSQSTNVLMFFFLVCNGPFGWPITQKIMKSSPPQAEITSFLLCFTLTLFYTAV